MKRPGGDVTGLRIRALRREAGMTQGNLAARSGISASYLNLIESKKRSVAGALLDRIAAALGVPRAMLDGETERRLVENLNEIAADPVIAADATPPAGTEELVGRHGDWAGLVQRVYRAYDDQRQTVIALADRLNRDPFLGESVHRMLTQITSVRSAAEILQSSPDLAPRDRERFLAILAGDSGNLAETAQALARFFDSAETRIRAATPTEHVDTFIYESGNHFPALEAIAEEFAAGLPHDVDVAQAAEAFLGNDPLAHMTALRREAGEERWRFAMAHQAARRLAREAIAAIVENHPALASKPSREIATAALERYGAAALLMPYEPFLEAAIRGRYDIDLLARRFRVSYEQAAHRLATLRRPGAEGVRFAFMRSDPSGYIDKRLPLPHLPLPRYGSACPLWAVYAAFQSPGVTARRFGALPDGRTFLFFARTIDKVPPAIGRSRRLLSVMLACHADDASRTVYGDGIDRQGATEPVGTVCRLCPRPSCTHRQEAALIG